MSLVERLERWSKEFDEIRWDSYDYDLEAVEISDLLKESAQAIRGYQFLVDRQKPCPR